MVVRGLMVVLGLMVLCGLAVLRGLVIVLGLVAGRGLMVLLGLMVRFGPGRRVGPAGTVHTSTHTGWRGFYSIKTCDREDRTVIAQPLFFFQFFNFPTTEAADYLSVGTRPYSGALLLEPCDAKQD